MADLFCIHDNSDFGLKSHPSGQSNASLMRTNNLVESRQDTGLLKTMYPIYLYKPPFGYPRNVNVVFLRELAKNPYVFSVIKAIIDQAAETKWEIKPKKGVTMTSELEVKQNFITEFFKNPNSDYESFAQLLRKVIRDILVLDSGVFVKVFNLKKELVQLRVADGGAFLKNPDRHGSLAEREDIIFGDGYNDYNNDLSVSSKIQSQAYKFAIDRYNSYGYTDQAAYFQFAYGVNYSVPIPYGKREVIYMMENPDTEQVYSVHSALQSAIDVTLNLIYSSKASLDLFLNANIPTGIVQIAGAQQEDADAFQEKLYMQQYSGYDEYGFQRKINGKIPVVGNPAVNFIPLNFNNKETQLLEIQEWFTKVLWSCFGMTASEMGFTEDSNKATDASQTKAAARKAVRPRLSMIEKYLNDQVMPELEGGDLFDFVFDNYDIDEDTKKWALYKEKIEMGVLTPEMVAENEGIDLEKLKGYLDERAERANQNNPDPDKNSNNFGKKDGKKEEKKDDKLEVKSTFEFSDKIVITGKTPEEILSQAVDLVEAKKEVEAKDDITSDDSEEKPIKEVVYEGAEEYNEEERNVIDETEEKGYTELKGEKKVGYPKKTATDVVMQDYYDEFEGMVKSIIDKV